MSEESTENLFRDLPDPDSARRFLGQLAEKYPSEGRRLVRDRALLSDVLTLVSFSPLLATTFLQHRSYLSWLGRQRASVKVRGKEELLESLARFALTSSTLEPNVQLARFRRRELLRIYLRDIRNLGTVAEITEEISNLADAILEHALRLARQELDNRFGSPLETDGKGRSKPARFVVVALGKLGSRELNYASDIDLLFLYSSEGSTSGSGSRGSVTNREYFVRLSEMIIKLVGQQTGEGAAYRVDMRLRPHGRVGALAITAAEAAGYYRTSAQAWERQVLIRSRAAAGDADVFEGFADEIEPYVFSADESVAEALANVRKKKEVIDAEKATPHGVDVKLGRGGIREIEFIAQALQIAYAGRDEWLRSAHTLISLDRLAYRGYLRDDELTALSDAYSFLRRLEHRIQMENGLQTHVVPKEPGKRAFIARTMGYADPAGFDFDLERHSGNVHRVFRRVFADVPEEPADGSGPAPQTEARSPAHSGVLASIAKSDLDFSADHDSFRVIDRIADVSPPFASAIAANPALAAELTTPCGPYEQPDFRLELSAAVGAETDFAGRIGALRRTWSRRIVEIGVYDIFGRLALGSAKEAQTALAEASLGAAVGITRAELERRFGVTESPFSVLGLGKLGGRGMDYLSDLDLLLVYDDGAPDGLGPEGRSRAVEIFVDALSSMTRDGSLYRVDLRLRPDGKNGSSSTGRRAFIAYLEQRAAVWEWLAYVKLRGVLGEDATEVEAEARNAIHARAARCDPATLRSETVRVRESLRLARSPRGGRQIDIKFGEGGLLDVYFAIRYLQLRDAVPDADPDRSTGFTLRRLRESRSLGEEEFTELSNGYAFLTRIDHEIRLTVGRSTFLPLANRQAMRTIASRMGFAEARDLTSELALHRLAVRRAYDSVLGL